MKSPPIPKQSGIESNEFIQEEPVNAETTAGRNPDNATGEGAEDGAVIGELRPLFAEGECKMVCIRYALIKTRYGLKDYLDWREAIGAPVLQQFFPHYDKYPINSKVVENYLAAMGERPKRLDRFSFQAFIGLQATVYVETVKPVYTEGALKGRPKPEATHYSKASQILRPLGHVDADSLRERRGESL
jgi:hypothetical protein